MTYREQTGGHTRRTVVSAVPALGVIGALAGCGGASEQPAASTTGAAAPTPAPSTMGATVSASIPTSQVPVGGGYVDQASKTVVTQPTAGTYKAFTAVCPHERCLVSKVTSTSITCPCHGSAFDASSGAVTEGPATSGLSAKTVTVSGSTIEVS